MDSRLFIFYFVNLFFYLFCLHVAAMPEQGIKTPPMICSNSSDSRSHFIGVSKSMYNGSVLAVHITCSPGLNFTVEWVVRSSFCANEFIDYDDENYQSLKLLYENVDQYVGVPLLDKHHFLKSGLIAFKCPPSGTYELPKLTKQLWNEVIVSEESTVSDKDDIDDEDTENGDSSEDDDDDVVAAEPEVTTMSSNSSTTLVEVVNRKSTGSKVSGTASLKLSSRKRRQVGEDGAEKKKMKSSNNATVPAKKSRGKLVVSVEPFFPEAILRVPNDGVFMFVMRADYDDKRASINVTVRTLGTYGYLSAIDWPLLPFYGVTCALYTISLIAWFVMCCCFRKDLLQIQYWIGAVLFIGFVEEAAFLGEYHTVNKNGQSLPGAVIFAELISALKRSLSRMLVIIVSVGFGIVKPRLGPTLPKVIGVGVICFIANSIEGFQRATTHKANQQSTGFMVLIIVLAVIDAAICWWIFTALVSTMRTLRIRRNVHKLSLYRHFTNTLIFSVLASLAFMVWSILEHKRVMCLTDWRELWVDEAFWHLLFSVILVVIMILFRPSANNQRYIYSPVADGEEDEAVEPMINESFEGMKMRGSKGSKDGLNSRHSENQTEDDLKWIEDNIPASVADGTLPSLLDSDEEIMTTKYEMSKMQ